MVHSLGLTRTSKAALEESLGSLDLVNFLDSAVAGATSEFSQKQVLSRDRAAEHLLKS